MTTPLSPTSLIHGIPELQYDSCESLIAQYGHFNKKSVVKKLMNYKYKTILMAATLSPDIAEAFVGEKPPKNSLPLTDVIKSLEAKGYSSITKVDGRSPNNTITSTLSKENFLQ